MLLYEIMKKSAYKIVMILLVGIFILNFVCANIDSQIENKVKELDEGAQKIDKIASDKEYRDEYLKNEWKKIFESKPVFKQVISVYKKISIYLDPTTEYLIGVAPSFSLLFFLSIIIFIMLIRYSFVIYEALRDFSVFSRATSIWISLSVFIILIILGVFRSITYFISSKLIALINIVTSPVARIIFIISAIIILFIIIRFGSIIKVLIGKYRDIRDAKKQVNEVKDVKKTVKGMAKNMDSISSGFSYTAGMRRGGDKSDKGRFVSKRAVEKYTKMYGEDAARKRFGGQ